jgi:MerR family regulatory protein
MSCGAVSASGQMPAWARTSALAHMRAYHSPGHADAADDPHGFLLDNNDDRGGCGGRPKAAPSSAVRRSRGLALTLEPGPGFTVAGVATRTISWAAADAGVSPDTLRYYERAGLLEPPERSSSGYRIYDASTTDRTRRPLLVPDRPDTERR